MVFFDVTSETSDIGLGYLIFNLKRVVLFECGPDVEIVLIQEVVSDRVETQIQSLKEGIRSLPINGYATECEQIQVINNVK